MHRTVSKVLKRAAAQAKVERRERAKVWTGKLPPSLTTSSLSVPQAATATSQLGVADRLHCDQRPPLPRNGNGWTAIFTLTRVRKWATNRKWGNNDRLWSSYFRLLTKVN